MEPQLDSGSRTVRRSGIAQSTGQRLGRVDKLTKQKARHSFRQNAFFSMLCCLDFHTSMSIKNASICEDVSSACPTEYEFNNYALPSPAPPPALLRGDEQLQGMLGVVKQLYNLTIMSIVSISFISSLQAPVSQKEFN